MTTTSAPSSKLARRELPDVADVRAELLVGERGAVLGRCGHVDDRVERLVVDVDELRRVDGVRARVGDHDRDPVALVVHLGDGEREVLGALHVLGHRPRARHRRRPVVAQLGAGEDGDDALGRLRGGRVDGGDLRVRVRAPDDRHRQRARDHDVVDEAPSPAEERVVLLALQRDADLASGLRGAHDALPAAAAIASTMLW